MRAWAVAGCLVLAAMATGCRTAPAEARPPEYADAEAAILAGEWGRAEALLHGVLVGRDPRGLAATCHYWIAVCRRQQSDPDGARRAYAKAVIARDPAVEARARLGLADLAWAAGEPAAAREQYARAAELAGHLVADDADRARERAAP